MNPLEIPLIARLRAAHALEHATMHILAESYPNLEAAGRTSLDGFYLYAPVRKEDVSMAAREGLRRLQAGEKRLAVHPHCGTGLAVAGLLAGLSSLLATRGGRRLTKLPRAILAATLAILAAQPLGLLVQERITTSPELARMRIEGVLTLRGRRGPVHKVKLVRD